VKEKRDDVVLSLNAKIEPLTAAPIERTRRELSIDMALGGPILKFDESTIWLSFTFTPKLV